MSQERLNITIDTLFNSSYFESAYCLHDAGINLYWTGNDSVESHEVDGLMLIALAWKKEKNLAYKELFQWNLIYLWLLHLDNKQQTQKHSYILEDEDMFEVFKQKYGTDLCKYILLAKWFSTLLQVPLSFAIVAHSIGHHAFTFAPVLVAPPYRAFTWLRRKLLTHLPISKLSLLVSRRIPILRRV